MAFTELFCDASAAGDNMSGGAPIGGAYPITYTSGNWVAATGVFTPAAGDPIAAGVTVGDFAGVYNDGATTPVFVGRVTARTTTTITVSLTAKSGTAPTDGTGTRSIKVGGAWKGPNGAVNFPFGFITNTLTDASSNPYRVNYKDGTNYAITAAISHSGAGPGVFEGYTSAAGDGGRAIIDGGTSGASYILLTLSGAKNLTKNLIGQNNGATGSAAGFVFSGAGQLVVGCVVNNVRGHGFHSSSGQTEFIECEAYACNQSNTGTMGGFTLVSESNLCVRCISHDNAGNVNNGYYATGTTTFIDCIADTNGKYGYAITGVNRISLIGCVAYANGGDGVTNTNNVGIIYCDSCIFVSNGGYGIDDDGGPSTNANCIINCAFYLNTSGQVNTTNINSSYISGSITLTGDPFVAPTTGDFDLNSTAGAGAACRNAGRGAFTQTAASYTGTLSYPDVGASQHQDAGGSSTLIVAGQNYLA